MKRGRSHFAVAVLLCAFTVSNGALAGELVPSTTTTQAPPSASHNMLGGSANLASHAHALTNTTGLSAIAAGGHPVALGSQITPAQALAAMQIFNSGHQTTVLDNLGAAIGGSLLLPKFNTGDVVIPHGVTVLSLANKSASTTITGDLINLGALYFASTDSNQCTSTLNAHNISNQAGAIISSAITDPAVLGFGGAVPGVNLRLTAAGNFNNAGTISSGGDLSLSSKTGNFTNSGIISAATGNIGFSTAGTNASILLDNTGGTISAPQGNINISTAGKTNANITVTGGDLLSQELNAGAHDGKVSIDARNITGQVNITDACGANVQAATPNLLLGTMNINGDPTFFNTAGSITLDGQITTSGAPLAIIASQDIYTVTNTQRDQNGFPIEPTIDTTTPGGTAGNILIVAGANVTSNGSSQGSNDHTTTITFTGASATGGSIDLTTFDGITKIVADGHAPYGLAGNITLAAFSGNGQGSPLGLTPGTVHLLSTSTISSNADHSGPYCGSITIVGGAPTSAGTAISVGNISATGDGAGGNISVIGAAPVVPSGFSVQVTDGAATGPFTYESNATGNISVAGAITGKDVLAVGQDITIGGAVSGNNVTAQGHDVTIGGAINGNNVVASGNNINIAGTVTASSSLNLSAEGNIGSQYSPIQIAGAPNVVVNGGSFAYLNALGSLNFSANSGAGAGFNVTAANDITAANGVTLTSVGDIKLTSTYGSIGTSGNPLNLGGPQAHVAANAPSPGRNVYLNAQGTIDFDSASSAGSIFSITGASDITSSIGTINADQVFVSTQIGRISFTQPVTANSISITRSDIQSPFVSFSTLQAPTLNLIATAGNISGTLPSAVHNVSAQALSTSPFVNVSLSAPGAINLVGSSFTNGFMGTFAILAGGNITESSGANIRGNTITLGQSSQTAIDAGSSTTPLALTASNLSANVRNAFVSNTGTVTVLASTLSGQLQLTSTGPINIAGNVSTLGIIALTATGDITTSGGASLNSGGSDVLLTASGNIGSQYNPIALGTTSQSLVANATGYSHSVYINASGSIDFDGPSGVDPLGGTFNVTSAGDITSSRNGTINANVINLVNSQGRISFVNPITANTINFKTDTNIDSRDSISALQAVNLNLVSTNGNITATLAPTVSNVSAQALANSPAITVSLTAPGSIIFSGASLANGPSGTFAITAGGNITQSTGANVTATTVSVAQSSPLDVGSASAPFAVTASNVNANVRSAFISNTGSVSVGASQLTDQFQLSATGAVNVAGNLNATNAIALNAGGAITQSGGATITTNALTLGQTAPAIPATAGSAGTPLVVTASTINANLASAYITTTSAVSIGNSQLTDQLQVTAPGQITVSGVVSANNAITLQAPHISVANSLNASTVTLSPSSSTATMTIGGAGTFDVAVADLARITANRVVVGSISNTGGFTVSSALTQPSGTPGVTPGVYALDIESGAGVVFNNAVTADSLVVNTNSAINVIKNITGNNGVTLNALGNIAIQPTIVVRSINTDISITANDVVFASTGNAWIAAGTGHVSLIPSGSQLVTIGGTSTFNVTQNMLSRIVASKLTIGSLNDTSNLVLSIALLEPTGTAGTTAGVYDLDFETGGAYGVVSTNPSLNTRGHDLTINSVGQLTTGTGGIAGGNVVLNSSQPTAGGAGVYVNGAISAASITLTVAPSSSGYIVLNGNLTATNSIDVEAKGTGYTWIGASKTYQTTNGPITLGGNTINWTNIGTSVIKAGGSGTVYLLPSPNTQPVSFGGSTGFSVPTTALSRIIAGELVIGSSSNTANFTVDGSYAMPATGTVGTTGGLYALTFQTGGNFSSSSTAVINVQGQELSVTAGGSLAAGKVTGTAASGTALSGQTISQVAGPISTHDVVLSTTGGNIYGTSSTTPFSTQSAVLMVNTPGNTLITNAGALQIGSSSVGGMQLTTTGTGANISTFSDISSSGSAGPLQLAAAGTLTVTNNITATSNQIALTGNTGVTIASGAHIQAGVLGNQSAGQLLANSDIASSGSISVTAGTTTTAGDVTISGGSQLTAYGTTSSPGNVAIVSQNGAIYLNGAQLSAMGGNLQLFATGNIMGTSGNFFQAKAVGTTLTNPTTWVGGGIEFGAGTTPSQTQLAAAFTMPAGTTPSTSIGSAVQIDNTYNGHPSGAVVANVANGGTVNLTTSGYLSAYLGLRGGAMVFDANNGKSIQIDGGMYSTSAFAPIAFSSVEDEYCIDTAEDQ